MPILPSARQPIHRALLGVATVAFAVSCSDSPERSVQGFCDRLAVERTLLTARLTEPAQVQPLVDRFRALNELAPEQIRVEFNEIVVLVETVAAAELSPESQNELVKLALATDPSIEAVTAYARTTCQVELTTP